MFRNVIRYIKYYFIRKSMKGKSTIRAGGSTVAAGQDF